MNNSTNALATRVRQLEFALQRIANAGTGSMAIAAAIALRQPVQCTCPSCGRVFVVVTHGDKCPECEEKSKFSCHK